MRIAVGSRNPVKVEAVRKVISRIWAGAEVVSVDVASGISYQPTSDEEAIEGAVNRAKLALEKAGADYGIGIEGCVAGTKYGTFLSGWTAIVNREGIVGLGSGCRLLLPEKIASSIRMGRELGQIIDELIGEKDIKEDRGAIGVFTQNLMTRTVAIEASIICALVRFLSSHYYE